MRKLPRITVAAIIERNGKFLMVEELDGQKSVYNQPAGHMETGENLLEAVARETLEETAWEFIPEHIVGIYHLHVDTSDKTYLRVCFSGQCGKHIQKRQLDDGILRALWLSRDELSINQDKLRSPLVLKGIDDYLSGQCYSMEMIHDFENL